LHEDVFRARTRKAVVDNDNVAAALVAAHAPHQPAVGIGDVDDAHAIRTFNDRLSVGAAPLGADVACIDGEAIAFVVPDDGAVALPDDGGDRLRDEGAVAFAHLLPFLAHLRDAARRLLAVAAQEFAGVAGLRRRCDRRRCEALGGRRLGGRLLRRGGRCLRLLRR